MSFIVPTTLASVDDFTEWTMSTSAPDNIELTLRACTTRVLDATKTARYATDPSTGLATDPVVKNALRDATCIQASAWVALNIDPATGGVIQTTKTVKSKKIGTAQIEYSDAEAQAVNRARAAAYASLVPEARSFLRTRGLITSAVSSA
ncbi:hypothetical protein [Microbacterium allomyrinae]|uniref:Uncharacterized protein n=1 Tax=Microbacterium allomyrinae TaxID=2830666 RepID=A0A9X1S413_9MICO|nr:hypothetical protein [Microbacterium allomyrinae]MCC2033072.1 hypothetical protein [Microbacterium allomyrinae]